MQKTLDNYGSGIQITQVQMQKVDPPAQVIDAFRDVQAARADLERLQNEAQTYANRVVPEARGTRGADHAGRRRLREQTVAEAKGQSARFLKVYDEYKKAPDVTRQRIYLETMERVLGGTDKIIYDGDAGGPGRRALSAAQRADATARAPAAAGAAGRAEARDEAPVCRHRRCSSCCVARDRRLQSLFTVHQTEQALVVRLGEPVRVVTAPGLNFKAAVHRHRRSPSTSASSIWRTRRRKSSRPTRSGWWSTPSRATASRTRCASIRRVGSIQGANSSLSTLLNSALRRVLGEVTFIKVVRDERAAADGAHPRAARPRGRAATASRSSTCASAAPICRSRTARRSISACRPSASARPPSSAPRARSARRRSAPRADREVTVLVAEANSQGRADPRRGRRRAQPDLRRSLRPGSGFLRLLPLDDGL